MTRRRHAPAPRFTGCTPQVTLRRRAVHQPQCQTARDVANGIACGRGDGMSLLDFFSFFFFFFVFLRRVVVSNVLFCTFGLVGAKFHDRIIGHLGVDRCGTASTCLSEKRMPAPCIVQASANTSHRPRPPPTSAFKRPRCTLPCARQRQQRAFAVASRLRSWACSRAHLRGSSWPALARRELSRSSGLHTRSQSDRSSCPVAGTCLSSFAPSGKLRREADACRYDPLQWGLSCVPCTTLQEGASCDCSPKEIPPLRKRRWFLPKAHRLQRPVHSRISFTKQLQR